MPLTDLQSAKPDADHTETSTGDAGNPTDAYGKRPETRDADHTETSTGDAANPTPYGQKKI